MQKLAKQAFSKGWDPLESCSPIVCSEILFRCRREDADIDIQAWFPDMGWSTAGLSLDLVSCLWSQVWECLSYDSEYYLRSAFVNVATEFIKDEMLTLKWFVYIVHSITRFFVILVLLNSYPKPVMILKVTLVTCESHSHTRKMKLLSSISPCWIWT